MPGSCPVCRESWAGSRGYRKHTKAWSIPGGRGNKQGTVGRGVEALNDPLRHRRISECLECVLKTGVGGASRNAHHQEPRRGRGRAPPRSLPAPSPKSYRRPIRRRRRPQNGVDVPCPSYRPPKRQYLSAFARNPKPKQAGVAFPHVRDRNTIRGGFWRVCSSFRRIGLKLEGNPPRGTCYDEGCNTCDRRAHAGSWRHDAVLWRVGQCRLRGCNQTGGSRPMAREAWRFVCLEATPTCLGRLGTMVNSRIHSLAPSRALSTSASECPVPERQSGNYRESGLKTRVDVETCAASSIHTWGPRQRSFDANSASMAHVASSVGRKLRRVDWDRGTRRTHHGFARTNTAHLI